MIEYVFFHQELADAFVERLVASAVPYQAKSDELGLVVAVPDDIDGALLDELDAFSEELLARSEQLLEAADEGTERQAAALSIRLGDGRTTDAVVRPELMNKLLNALSFEELNELVEAIVDSVEHPDDRPFCRR